MASSPLVPLRNLIDVTDLAAGMYGREYLDSSGEFYSEQRWDRSPAKLVADRLELLHDAAWFTAQGDAAARRANVKATVLVVLVVGLGVATYFGVR